MKYWINTVCWDHVQIGVNGSFTQANHGSPRGLRRLSEGDWLVFYSPKTSLQNGEKLQCFTALGQVADQEIYQVEMKPDFHPHRRNVNFCDGQQAPIRPLLERLSFIKDKSRWGFPFRRGLFEIPEDDYHYIAEAMGVSIQ